MECESPASAVGQSRQPPPAHQPHRTSGGKHASGGGRQASLEHHQQQPHYHQPQLQHPQIGHQHAWGGGGTDSSLAGHVVGEAQHVSLSSSSAVVVFNQAPRHSYLTRNPQPSSSSTSSSSLHHSGMLSPPLSTVIIGGAVYDAAAVPLSLQRTLTHYESQHILLSSSSSSLSSSNLPVELVSGLATLHGGSSQSLMTLSSQHPRVQHQQSTLIGSPTMLMGPASGISLSQTSVGLPGDLISASSHSLGVSLAGYPAQYTTFPQQTFSQTAASSSYPFAISAAAAPGGHEPASLRRTHSSADRGDESPMVGVCIQQSPVASH